MAEVLSVVNPQSLSRHTRWCTKTQHSPKIYIYRDPSGSAYGSHGLRGLLYDIIPGLGGFLLASTSYSKYEVCQVLVESLQHTRAPKHQHNPNRTAYEKTTKNDKLACPRGCHSAMPCDHAIMSLCADPFLSSFSTVLSE